MNRLEELLNELFPITGQMDHMDEEINKIQRLAYADGFRAGFLHAVEKVDEFENDQLNP